MPDAATHLAAVSTLFDELGAIRSAPEFQHRLPALSRGVLAGKDPFATLLLAEHCAAWQNWNAAAELHALTAVLLPRSAAAVAPHVLTAVANELILLTRRSDPKLMNPGDLLVYCIARIRHCLSQAGVGESDRDRWIEETLVAAVARMALPAGTLPQSVGLIAHVARSRAANAAYAKSALAGALRLAANPQPVPQQAGRLEDAAFLAACALVLIDTIWLRDLIRIPEASTWFEGWNLLGAALVAWPQLLVVTWVFAWREAGRTRCRTVIPARYFGTGASICCGKIVPFYRDAFFHIYQFIWVAFLFSVWYLLSRLPELPAHLRRAWSPADPAGRDDMLAAMTASEAGDWAALALAVAIACIMVYAQVRIQRHRVSTNDTLYWWDRRISRRESVVRLVMVWIDVCVGAFLLVKVAVVGWIAYRLVSATTAKKIVVNYFDPDGVGGLHVITDIFIALSLIAFLLGILVIASHYLHRNLLGYRISDNVLLAVYGAFVVAITVALFRLESAIGAVRDQLLVSIVPLPSAAPPLTLEETAKRLKDIQVVRDWQVSAVSVGLLKSPVILLLSQAVFVVGQSAFGQVKAKLFGASADAGKAAKDTESA